MEEYRYNLQNKEIALKASAGDIEANWLWATISYLGPVFLLVLALRKESIYASYHARQGKGLFIAEVVWLVLWIGANVLVPASVRFVLLGITTLFLLGLISLIMLLVQGVSHALRGTMEPLILLGRYFEK